MSVALQSAKKPLWAQTRCLWPGRCSECEDRDNCPIQNLVQENELLKEEIRVSRESAEITAALVVKQFEETERVLRRFQVANAQRKAVLDSAINIAIIATEETGTIVVFNKGAENLLGYHQLEVIGQMMPTVFHDPRELNARAEALSRELGRAIDSVDIFFYYAAHKMDEDEEWTYVRKDGTQFPVNLSINPLRDAEGAISGFLCIAADITEKKRSEQALKESERNYRLLIDNIPNIVFKGYSDGTIDFFDDKIEALTGYSKAEFISRKIKWIDLICEEDCPGQREQFLRALKGDRQYIREYRIRRKDGDIVWVQASSQIISDAKGKIDFITGAILDITKRKSAEAAMHESEEKYRSLFYSGPNPIFVLDSTTLKILDVNPAAIEAYGYSKAEMMNQPFTRLGEFEIQEQGLNPSAVIDWPTGCFINQKARHHKKDGTPFYIRVKACPINYKDRRALILAATDITEAIEKDAQLFQATKMQTLGEMSAGMAHELTQPLNAIKIGNDYFSRMIAQGKRPSAKELERVALAVTDQVRRASDIINRLREFGRKPDFQKEPVDLNAVITNILEIIGHQLLLINIQVDLDLDPALPTILANFNRLEQVLFNLVSNARDAIEQLPGNTTSVESRIITVRTYSEAGDVVCVIADTGVGISIDEKDKIFEPFYTTKEVGKGMGLGLAISYGIVRDYGGTIEVSSLKERGTCMTLRFAHPQTPDSRDASRPNGA
jgi:PAS domain S-box-containing protein